MTCLVGYSPWGCNDLDTTQQLNQTWHSKWLSGEESACQCKRCRRPRFKPWGRKIPWRRKWQLVPVRGVAKETQPSMRARKHDVMVFIRAKGSGQLGLGAVCKGSGSLCPLTVPSPLGWDWSLCGLRDNLNNDSKYWRQKLGKFHDYTTFPMWYESTKNPGKVGGFHKDFISQI